MSRSRTTSNAYWNKEDKLQLSVVPSLSEAHTFVLHPELKNGPIVPLTTIDNLVAELELERVDYVKMDIEGVEQKALRGAAATIRRFKPKTGHHLVDDAVEIPKIVTGFEPGYRASIDYCISFGGDIRPGTFSFRH